MMLILTRKPGEEVLIGQDVVVTVVRTQHGRGVRLGFTAPADVPIMRKELGARREFRRPVVLRIAEIAAYVLDRETRQRVYEPALCDLEVDFLETREGKLSRGARLALSACFGIRIAWTLVACFITSTTVRSFAGLIRRRSAD